MKIKHLTVEIESTAYITSVKPILTYVAEARAETQRTRLMLKVKKWERYEECLINQDEIEFAMKIYDNNVKYNQSTNEFKKRIEQTQRRKTLLNEE